MELLSYILSLISTLLGLCEPFGKKMKTILIFNFCGNLLVGASYLLVSVYSGAAICLVACIQVTINYFYDVRERQLPRWLIAIYAIAFLLVNLLTFKSYFDILALIAAMLFVFSLAQKDAKYYRVLYALNSTTWIFYDFLTRSYGNLFTHVVLFAATSIAILVRDAKKK